MQIIRAITSKQNRVSVLKIGKLHIQQSNLWIYKLKKKSVHQRDIYIVMLIKSK